MCDNCGCDMGQENIFLPKEVKILRAEQVTEHEKHFTLRMADDSPFNFTPGQILEVSMFGFGEIPIGLASSPVRTNSFDIVIRGVGRVSNAINQLAKGDSLFIRGPYGNGFDLENMRNNNVLIVAGGIGLCPTRSLIQYIIDRREEFKNFTLFYGTRDPASQMFHDDLAYMRKATDIEYFETVDRADDSWKGNVGLITELFKKTKITADTRAVICGPPIMFKFVMRELNNLGLAPENIYVDLERRMKCGVGKCGHCQINDQYVCTDGPVFKSSEIANLEEAL
jgi:sulfhydrogenase subunit gamma (sulfur reductase)